MAYRRGIRTSYKYKFNENAFDNLTPETVYWLGFIYADGSIQQKRGILRITLHKKDKIILEKFKTFLNSNHPINNYSYRNSKNRVEIALISNHLIKILNELGVYQNKTKTIPFPDFLPENLYSDFIRGYFDGDGSLYKDRNGWTFSIQSNPLFVVGLQKILMKYCNLKENKLHKKRGTISVSMRYGGENQVKKIIDYIMQNTGFYLPRKLGRFLGV
ncbi:hypothetical protein KAT51_04195 [bacterium]|nr:hypothetical protein [bacterium]